MRAAKTEEKTNCPPGEGPSKAERRVFMERAMDEVHVERLIQKYKDSGELDSEDPALLMLKQWPASKNYKDNPDKIPGLEQKINRFLEILLESELNSEDRYEVFRDEDDNARKTLMHYAAELGFLHVIKTLVRKCPQLLTMTTKEMLKPEQKRAMLPVELAIMAENDDVAAFMVRVMWCERVQSLFSWTFDNMKNPEPSLFSFEAVIKNPKLKKTVVALLDQMVSPHWPYIPQRQENYETEEEREAIEGIWNTISDNPLNYHFYYHILDGDKGGRPPTIVASNGHKQIENRYFNWGDNSCLHAIAKSNNKEAMQHPVVRMLIKSKWKSYGHLFLRTAGLYTHTLAKIILLDVTRSMAVFVVIFFSFCGALSLSLCYTESTENQELRGFGDVLLSGFRALSEQYPMVEGYSTFNWLSVVLMMAYMGTVTVILLNILIAQMSTTYIQAKKVARLEYDVDRILQFTRMERFPFVNLRVKYYKEGDWLSEIKLAKELLEFSEDRNPWESVEEKLNEIRDLMRKMVKPMRPGQE
ncbi:hypothetical protein AWC38_SpisGene20699 [Stylophora pistillata]|uniref:Transient receptor potential cation channel subfamily V member 4 n=1 Tax=Stylophora pistillata TaxID=50429 RepID=A0A2B4RE55_STYPI|nr:hypothetical protein AWC38_SpisGene20699 [Stylophora pistillata]